MTAEDKSAPSMTNIMLSGKAKQKGHSASAENANSLTGQQGIDHLANRQVCLASLKGKNRLIRNTDIGRDGLDFVYVYFYIPQYGGFQLII